MTRNETAAQSGFGCMEWLANMNATVTFKCAGQKLCTTTMPVPPRIGERIEHLETGKAYIVDNVVWHILTANDNFPSHEATVYVTPVG